MVKDSISHNIEEYLEVLYRNGSNKEPVSTTVFSKELGIAPGSVTQMLKKLGELEYVEYVPYKGASLTDKGMEIAQNITRKHRILEKFLKDVLKIKKENVHSQACEMEHALSDEAERALCFMLDHPDSCPDKKIIPACNFNFINCEDCHNESDFDNVDKRVNNLLAVSEINSSNTGTVAFIRGDNDFVNRINDMGIDIGTKIDFITSDEDNVSVFIDDNVIALDKEFANNIFVDV